MANPIYSGIVPDLCSHEEEGEEFLGSFFESLEVESYKARSQSRIWHTVRWFCDLERQPYTAEVIRQQFEKKFAENIEFEEKYWSKPAVDEPGLDEADESDEEDE